MSTTLTDPAQQLDEQPARILRFPDVVIKTGLSRSTVYGRIKAGDFPAPIPLGDGRAVGFLEREVHRWINSMALRRTDGASELCLNSSVKSTAGIVAGAQGAA